MDYPPIQGHQVVCSAFIEKENKVLIVMCPLFRVWRVPGGRPERGEILEETLLREMQEETRVLFQNPLFIGWGQDKQYNFAKEYETSRLLMFFRVKTNEELVLDPDECLESRWVTLEELRSIENKEGALNDYFQRNPNFKLI